MSNLKLAFVLEAVDRASARLKAIGDRMDKLTEPARRVRARLNDMLSTGPLLRLRSGVADVGDALGRLQGLAQGVAAGIGLVAAGATAAFFGVKRIADQTDALADDAARLGITTQQLQELGYAAQLSGSSVEDMGQSLGFLSNNLVQARQGNKELVQWLARVGVTAQDLRNPAFGVTDVLARMADTYERVGKDGLNSAEMIAASRALMGRSGDRLNQLLRQGSAALRQYAAEARRLGVVLDEQTVRNMGAFNDEFDRTKLILFGNLASALRPVMPMLSGVIERIGRWAVANRELISTRLVEFMQRVEQVLPAIVRGGAQLAAGLGALIGLLDTVAQAMGGWQNVIAALAAVLALQGVLALVSLGQALWGVGAALAGVTVAGAPILLLFGKLLLVAGALYLAWQGLKKLGSMLFPNGMSTGSPMEPAKGQPSIYAGEEEWRRWREQQQGSAIQPQAAKVGGTLRVEVVGPGRVTGVERTPGSGMEIDAYSGPAMAGVAGF